MAVIGTKTLTMEKQTKGAVLYTTRNNPGQNGNGSALITSIYLRKDGFPSGKYPGTITVSVETDEDLGE